MLEVTAYLGKKRYVDGKQQRGAEEASLSGSDMMVVMTRS